jgi:hypothetical protein
MYSADLDYIKQTILTNILPQFESVVKNSSNQAELELETQALFKAALLLISPNKIEEIKDREDLPQMQVQPIKKRIGVTIAITTGQSLQFHVSE